MPERLHIVLADDNPNDRLLAVRELEQEFQDLRVTHVTDGEAFARALDAGGFELVITDYQLHWTTGLDVLRTVRDRFPDTGVIMFTATGTEEIAVEAMKSGLDDYVLKSPKHFQRLPAAVRSVLEKRRQRRAAREAEMRYRRLFQNVPIGLFRTAPDGRILDANPAARRILGFDEGVPLDQVNVMDVYVNAEDRRRFQEAMAQQGWVQHFEVRARRRDGEVIWVEIDARAVRDPAGNILYYEGAFEDITRRMRALEALRESEERYRSLIDDVVDVLDVGVFILDRNFRMVWLNRAMERFFGLRREQVIGQDKRKLIQDRIRNVFEDPEAFASKVLATYDNNTYVENFECHVLPDSGREERWLKHWSKPIESGLYAGGRVEHYYDITARKRAEEEHRKLEAQFRQAQKMEAVGRLAGGVAHDFNNLLSVIQGYSYMAMSSLSRSDPLYEDIEQINEAAKRSANLTRQLMAFSRQQTIAPRVLNLNEQLQSMERLLKRLVGEDIDLQLKLSPDVWPVYLDPTQMDQVLANLAVNARDAMPNGGSLVVETANVALDQSYCDEHVGFVPGEYAMLAVSDTGCGMDSETLEHVFEPFFTTKKDGKGTGLGLSTVYGIVKQNKGFVNIYSEPGQGTTIKIYFPRYVGEEEVGEIAVEEPQVVGGVETILLVEDDEPVRALAKRVLERLGYKVLEASRPGEAITLCEKHEGDIHLLLTDVVMPAMNGKELYSRISALKPRTRVLYMSGYTGDVIAHRGVLEKGTQFLQKPFTPDSLARKVRQVLDMK